MAIYLGYAGAKIRFMALCHMHVLFFATLSPLVLCNPLPMPADLYEDIYVDFREEGGKVYADFSALYYTYTPIPEETFEILYPILDGATSISVQGEINSEHGDEFVDMNWEWSNRTYPTILPELPSIPIMAWKRPFPVFEYGGVFRWANFRITFKHELIKRGDEFIFFYPLGVWKLLPTDPDESRVIQIYIGIPANYEIRGTWLDDEVCSYQEYSERNTIRFRLTTEEDRPDEFSLVSLRKDLIVSIRKKSNAVSVWQLYR